MSKARSSIALAAALFVVFLVIEALAAGDDAGEAKPVEIGLSYLDATVLGVVEGITEFLPVSSTGHLILANRALGLDSEEPARDAAGNVIWIQPPDPETGIDGRPFTRKDAADVYAIVIQGGAIVAVVLLYWRTILIVLKGMVGRDEAGLRLFRNLALAFTPAVVIGLSLEGWIDRNLFSPATVATALIFGAIVMLIVSRWQTLKTRKYGGALADPELSDLTVGQSLLIGFCQCFALWPGMSRSMVTIVGGYIAGLRPPRAAEFSFLLGLPTLTGAAIYKGMGSGSLMLNAFGTGPVLWGSLVAAIAAFLSVRWLIRWLTQHGLAIFAWYRIAVAIAVIIFLV